MSTTYAHRRVVSFPTADLSDPRHAAEVRDAHIPSTAYEALTTLVLDLSGKLLSPSSLKEFIVPLGQRIRGGLLGYLRLVVATSDPTVKELIALLAKEYQLPVFISTSPDANDVLQATPAGDLTEADVETLEELATSGSLTTVSTFAGAVGLQPSAATNRLVNVERKGFVFRVKRGRTEGDLFVDPRVPLGTPLPSSRSDQALQLRQALINAGISSDPYAHPPSEVEGEPAEKLAELLRRRNKLS